jgi:hypothetical protein
MKIHKIDRQYLFFLTILIIAIVSFVFTLIKRNRNNIVVRAASAEPGYSIADINRDHVVNIQDFVILSANFGTNDYSADLNNDRIVNIQDFAILSANFGATA